MGSSRVIGLSTILIDRLYHRSLRAKRTGAAHLSRTRARCLFWPRRRSRRTTRRS
ncbi:MAG: hypothetical protein MZV64_64525 [Ignavibacteriales bacterium]|nr:hypothetical protein [Ignavibacteriales bacterium]